MADIGQLASAGIESSVFGAEHHGFRVNPPLTETDVCDFEARWRIALPDEFRSSLLPVGNGGAGPGYGLYPLGKCMHLRELRDCDPETLKPSDPFPHSLPWNGLKDKPDPNNVSDLALYDERAAVFLPRYFDSNWSSGAIPLSTRGCGLKVILVVTGLEKGTVWHDDRAACEGIYPVKQSGSERIGLFDWYRGWLNEALAKL